LQELRRSSRASSARGSGLPLTFGASLSSLFLFRFTANRQYVVGFGGQGDEEGRFHTPHGLALDSTGNLCVADKQNNRIQKFSPVGTPPADTTEPGVRTTPGG
jgi:NHL repeat